MGHAVPHLLQSCCSNVAVASKSSHAEPPAIVPIKSGSGGGPTNHEAPQLLDHTGTRTFRPNEKRTEEEEEEREKGKQKRKKGKKEEEKNTTLDNVFISFVLKSLAMSVFELKLHMVVILRALLLLYSIKT